MNLACKGGALGSCIAKSRDDLDQGEQELKIVVVIRPVAAKSELRFDD
jgi:hypothetical protein